MAGNTNAIGAIFKWLSALTGETATMGGCRAASSSSPSTHPAKEPEGRPRVSPLIWNDAVEKRSCGASRCDASSPEPAAKPNGVPGFLRDEGVAPTFCDEASPLPVSATASLRFIMVNRNNFLTKRRKGAKAQRFFKPGRNGF
jgi:hypothetical protein